MATLKKTWHVHACRGCGNTYRDTCDQAGEDATCDTCSGHRAWQLLVDNASPRTCCLNARLVNRDEKKTYRLAGRSNWHICKTCGRTHGHKITPIEVIPHQ